MLRAQQKRHIIDRPQPRSTSSAWSIRWISSTTRVSHEYHASSVAHVERARHALGGGGLSFTFSSWVTCQMSNDFTRHMVITLQKNGFSFTCVRPLKAAASA